MTAAKPELVRTIGRWALAGLVSNDALTLHYYRDAGLKRWVIDTLAKEKRTTPQ